MSGSSQSRADSWTYKIYFDPNASLSSPDCSSMISVETFLKKFNQLVGADECITEMWLYSHPLYSWQLTSLIMYHAFVLIRSNNWYWTIEKNSSGIIIQRSKVWKDVIDYIQKEKRVRPVTIWKRANGVGTFRGLMHWLHNNSELYFEYNITHWYSTCQGFAFRVSYEFPKKIQRVKQFNLFPW